MLVTKQRLWLGEDARGRPDSTIIIVRYSGLSFLEMTSGKLVGNILDEIKETYYFAR